VAHWSGATQKPGRGSATHGCTNHTKNHVTVMTTGDRRSTFATQRTPHIAHRTKTRTLGVPVAECARQPRLVRSNKRESGVQPAQHPKKKKKKKRQTDGAKRNEKRYTAPTPKKRPILTHTHTHPLRRTRHPLRTESWEWRSDLALSTPTLEGMSHQSRRLIVRTRPIAAGQVSRTRSRLACCDTQPPHSSCLCPAAAALLRDWCRRRLQQQLTRCR